MPGSAWASAVIRCRPADRLPGPGDAVANELRVFDGSKLAAVHPRLIAAGDEHLELDHYLEILVRKPGALPGSAALAQARAAGVFTSVHEAFWAAARARHGDAAGTRALIEVLLLHRRMPAAGDRRADRRAGRGQLLPDVVAVEARKHAAATPGRQRAGLAGGAAAALARGGHHLRPGGSRSRRTPARRRRWLPTTSCSPPGKEARDGPGRARRADRHRR